MINEYVPIRKCASLLEDLHFPKLKCAEIYDLYHKCVTYKLNKLFKSSEIYTKRFNKYPAHKFHKIIWVFWWQGVRNMPNIVHQCIHSMHIYSRDYHIILITKNNIKSYATLPKYIYDKIYKKEITLTHFSDILRFNLLKQYGGLWIDSTVFLISYMPFNIDKDPLFTVNSGYIKDHGNVSLGKWTGFFFGGESYQPLFIFMDHFFKLYWKVNNSLIDYFLVDYALNYAYIHNIGKFRQIDKNVPDMPNILKMGNLLNCNYNKILYNKLSHNTLFFKLTYKIHLKKDKNSFYNKLVNNK